MDSDGAGGESEKSGDDRGNRKAKGKGGKSRDNGKGSLKIRIKKKGGRRRRRRSDDVDDDEPQNSSDEEFERRLEEAQAVQDMRDMERKSRTSPTDSSIAAVTAQQPVRKSARIRTMRQPLAEASAELLDEELEMDTASSKADQTSNADADGYEVHYFFSALCNS